MRVRRIFHEGPLAAGDRVTLASAAAEHLCRVLRARAGDRVLLFDGTGGEFHAEILAGTDTSTVLRVLERNTSPTTESPLDITLLQGVSRGERMDFVLQKATELGVTTIVPVITERCVVRLDGRQAEKRHTHWRAITAAACEQCGRTILPVLAPVTTLATLLTRASTGTTRVMLSPDGERPLSEVARNATHIEILIGPEGGLAPTEQQRARSAGFIGTSLGPRVLRTETAALVAVAVVQLVAGDLARC